MYIIVVGGGELGYYLSRILLSDDYEVLIMEMNGARSEKLAGEFGSIVVHGDGCEATTLDRVGTGRADMLIAVTGDDEDNLVACQVAKHKFNVPRTIARIKNPRNEAIFKILGIDATVNTTNLILAHIEQELPSHPLIPLLKLKGSGLEVVEIKIPPGAPVVGKKLGDLRLPSESLVSLIIRSKGPQIPSGDTVIDAEDEVVAVTRPESKEALQAALTGM
ncbi:potassium channel family protein [Chloroflexota bacterium]